MARDEKRVHRLWKQEGLRVPQKKRNRRFLGKSESACDRYRAQRKNQVWSCDSGFDVTEDGRQLEFLAITDAYTRECHALKVATSICAVHVQDILDELFAALGHMTPQELGA